MYKENKIAVVVPAYNEERFIAQVLTTMPSFVDQIYAVNDASTDCTLEVMQQIAQQNGKIAVVNRRRRGGIGAAVTAGHKKALEDRMDVIAVMAGDGQMDPMILDRVLDPIVEGKADYSKGDRLSIPKYREGMPIWRRFGNSLLSFLTKIASGYWCIVDPQNGYTAISWETLRKIDLDKVYEGFAFENDLLVKLNACNARVADVPMPARYRGEKSKIRYSHFIVNTSWLLLKDFIWRIWVKHIRRNSLRL